MTENKNILRAFGVAFLALGLVWLSVILARGEGPVFKKTTTAGSYQRIEQELTVRLKGHPVSKRIPKQYIYHFWVLAGWEFVCALGYVVAGIALLRGYPAKRGLCAGALAMDAALKLLIVSYHFSVLQPLKRICQTADILKMYFMPDTGIAATLSSYLTGVRLARPGALLLAGGHVAFWTLSYLCLVRRSSSNA